MFSNKQRKFPENFFPSEADDRLYMQRCLRLAAGGEGLTYPNPMVGSVIVHAGRIIGEGWHHRAGQPHAEPNAIRSVKDQSLLKESTLYVSLEPCAHHGKTPPCADLILEKQIPRVVVGCADPFPAVSGQGIARLREGGAEVTVGVEEEACLLLNRRFFTVHLAQRPHITLKWAQTLDAFIDRSRDDDSEPPLLLSDALTATLCHRLRACSQLIAVGRRTQELDHPQLNIRHWPAPHGQQPAKAVISHRLTDQLPEWLHGLYEKGIQTLLVEGGSRLLQSFIDQDLWDEIQVETAPFKLKSGHPAPLLPTPADGHLSQKTVTADGHLMTTLIRRPEKFARV